MSPTRSGGNSERCGLDRVAWVLFGVCLLAYLFSRLSRIERFPIYFFCDEAIHTVHFHELVRNGWHGVEEPHEFLPAYYLNGGMFNLSLSVFAQGLASLIGGQTITTVRFTSALVSLTAAVALALLLRQVFRAREWWSVVAFLTITPCWFLHTRTGFETVLMVSSYSWFLYSYSRYRSGSPHWVFAAVAACAATFYAYSPGQGVMAITGALVLVFDFSYHWKQRSWVFAGVAFALLLFAPYVRFRLEHANVMQEHLRALSSYWIEPIALSDKLLIFLKNYATGLSPHYWFAVGADPAVRHVVPNQPHFPAWVSPFALVGLIRCLVGWRSPHHRLVLIAILASPFSSALVAPMVTRMLALVVPFALCTALGFDWLTSQIRSVGVLLTARIASCGLLALASFALLEGAIADAPLYTRNYRLYGLQWGAPELFRDIIPRYLASEPSANIVISHIWFNGPEVFPAFFGWANDQRVIFASFDQICDGSVIPEPKDLVVLTAVEFDQIKGKRMVQRFVINERIDFPDGQPGYYLGHLFLDPELKADAQIKSGWHYRPEWDRVVVGNLPFSVIANGAESGRAGSLFGESGGEVISKPGEPINLEVRFDGPVELRLIRVETDPGCAARVSIWGSRSNVIRVSLLDPGCLPVTDGELGGAQLDSIRVELAPQPTTKVRLLRVSVLPAKPGY